MNEKDRAKTIITILNKMGATIKLKNKKIYKGEKIADIMVKSPKSIKSINCPSKLNSGAIDEFLVIFLVAAKANGIDLPSSCCSGVCTSCASMVIDGSVEQEDAMGLNDDLKEKGFALLCVAYPKSDLHIIVGDEVEDNLYNNQFGKYQK